MFLRSIQPTTGTPQPPAPQPITSSSPPVIRSPGPASSSSQHVSIRDVMRMHGLEVQRQNRNNNNVLPSINNSYQSSQPRTMPNAQQQNPIVNYENVGIQQKQQQARPNTMYDSNTIMKNLLDINLGYPICPPQHI